MAYTEDEWYVAIDQCINMLKNLRGLVKPYKTNTAFPTGADQNNQDLAITMTQDQIDDMATIFESQINIINQTLTDGLPV